MIKQLFARRARAANPDLSASAMLSPHPGPLPAGERGKGKWSARRAIGTLALTATLSLAAPLAAGYTLEKYQFEDAERTEKFRELLGELRCVVCQNETLSSSQADVAQIMREEIYRLAQDGKSDIEIKDHLVERYGDFVLYDPPLKPSTLIVWFGPFVLIGIGAVAMIRTLQSKKRDPEAELSDTERERLAQLLNDKSDEDART